MQKAADTTEGPGMRKEPGHEHPVLVEQGH